MRVAAVVVADAYLYLGFVALTAGIWLQWGLGAALIVAGVLMFAAGGLSLPRTR